MIIKQVLLRVVHNSNNVPVIFSYGNQDYYYAHKNGLNGIHDEAAKAIRTSINVLVKTEYIPSLVYKILYGIPNYANNPN